MDLELELSSIDGIDDTTKSLYMKVGDVFKLNPVVAGFQTRVGQMDHKIAELLTETKQFKSKAKTATQELEEKRLADLEKNNDFESFKNSTQEKHLKELQERDELAALYKSVATKQTSGHDAMRLASDIAITINGTSTVGHLEPQFAKRLKTVFNDGKAEVQVLDKNGQLSAMTQKELQEEIKALPENSMLVSGSKGKGAGIAPNAGSHAGGVDLSKMSPRQKLEYARQ